MFPSIRVCVLCCVMGIGGASAGFSAETYKAPTCLQVYGSVAIQMPGNQWWAAYHLASPETLIRRMVRRSGCFTLTKSTTHADYLLEPDVFPNTLQHNGSGPYSISQSMADVRLSLKKRDISGENVTVYGHGEYESLGYGHGGGLPIFAGDADEDIESYAAHTLGQVVTIAYMRAYTRLVTSLSHADKPRKHVTLSEK